MMETPVRPRLVAALSLVFVGFATACAHVGQEQFDTEIAAIRAALELEDPSAAVSNRNAAQIAALATRLDRLTDGLSDLEDEFEVTIERFETAIWLPFLQPAEKQSRALSEANSWMMRQLIPTGQGSSRIGSTRRRSMVAPIAAKAHAATS